MSSSIEEFIGDCEKLSQLYHHRYLENTIAECPDYENNVWDSLRFFLKSYAFERQGRSADYAFIANSILVDMKDKYLEIEAGIAREIWQKFVDELKPVKPNPQNNPLCPRGEKCPRKYKGKAVQTDVKGISAVEFVLNEISNGCIVIWARDMLIKEQIQVAHTMLCKVNGVGRKIASLFLRDVETKYKIHPNSDRELLQPIDSWIRFVVHELAGDSDLDDIACAKFVVDNSRQPEKFNQGAWYFSNQIAHSSRYLVKKSIYDRSLMQDLIYRHIEELESNARIGAQFSLKNKEGM